SIFVLTLTSMFWGVTNPLLKKYSCGIENVQGSSRLTQIFAELRFLISRPKYILAFLLNQVGSLLFFMLLGSTDLSLAVPIANGLTFLITTITGQLLGEENLDFSGWLGVVLLFIGLCFCIAGK
ncbi:putative transmembrane family 234, partial [Trinorchestia longiramus]